MRRLTKSEAEIFRNGLIGLQGNRCALCKDTLVGKRACLDHDHRTGQIREVLCLNCNGIEGKIFNLCRRAKRNQTERWFLAALGEYWEKHSSESQHIHPAHRTADEKRLARNKRARLRRAKK